MDSAIGDSLVRTTSNMKDKIIQIKVATQTMCGGSVQKNFTFLVEHHLSKVVE